MALAREASLLLHDQSFRYGNSRAYIKRADEGAGLSKPLPKFNKLVENVDYYKEGDKVVFTSVYHLKRGYCCHSKCRHCPYGLGVAQEVRIDIQGVPAPVVTETKVTETNSGSDQS